MRTLLNSTLLLNALATLVLAQGTKPNPLTPLSIQQVVVEDEFWTPRLKVWRAVTVPDCFAKFEKDGALANFDKVRDGTGGEHGGPPWYDGLIYEMIRGCADFLAARRDPALESRLDGYIERIAAAAARDTDGYLNTYTQLREPTHRWGLNGGNDNWQHDVYNAGAMIEAAVHYYRATGKMPLLKTAVRLANHMADVMGPSPKKNVVPGHSLGEEALVKLYLLFREKPELKSPMSVPVDEQRYLKLAEFWIENRGNHEGRKSYGPYGQDHKPVLQQETIEGHAVRATLLCAGLVAAGSVNGREDYLAAAQRLWANMVERRMYVIGGLGAIAGHEGFGPDYVLPNNGYLETCAAIGAGFFHHNLNLALGDARYADELERVLYNGVLSGVSLKGDTYFYENPLEAGKNRTRWAWHGCPCCPPMFLKIMGALPGYIYAQGTNSVYANLFVGSRANLTVNGVKVALRQTTHSRGRDFKRNEVPHTPSLSPTGGEGARRAGEGATRGSSNAASSYPWQGDIQFIVEPERETEFALNLRMPGWCAEPQIKLNGQPLASFEKVRGYARLERSWQRGDVVELSLPMPVERIQAHPKVEAALGRVVLQRGPIVYCLEACDNGGHLRNLVLPPDSPLIAEHRADFLGGVTVIRGAALGLHRVDWPDTLYLPHSRVPGVTNVNFLAIPYFANANRQPTEMRVWMASAPIKAEPLPLPTLASEATPSASRCWTNDTLAGLNDQVEPAASDDAKIPRFTWWDHRGTKEWVQYDFDRTQKVSAVEVYWWDERRINAHCRVPQSWRLLFKDGTEWKLVPGASEGGTKMDQYNRVTFPALSTPALRMEVQLQPEWSGGILEWRLE
ncbi:MAG: glycoside hydrolase family 127 protein [Verrucomicrobia bacterium]|nr:glycoside hydrolase family 127 protein [Verrucomicrobiota bacterium]